MMLMNGLNNVIFLRCLLLWHFQENSTSNKLYNKWNNEPQSNEQSLLDVKNLSQKCVDNSVKIVPLELFFNALPRSFVTDFSYLSNTVDYSLFINCTFIRKKKS